MNHTSSTITSSTMVSQDSLPRTLPYGARPHQRSIITEIAQVLENREHLIMESGTGTGKTISTLAPAVDYALRNGKRIVYLTRTNSQQKQVILELRAIMSKIEPDPEVILSEDFIPCIGLQGRKSMCCMVGLDPEFDESSSEELSRLCNRLKRSTRGSSIKGVNYPAISSGGPSTPTTASSLSRDPSSPPPPTPTKNSMSHADQGTEYQLKKSLNKNEKFGKAEKICPFYLATLGADLTSIALRVRTEIPTAEDFIPEMKKEGLCPYELNKTFIERAMVVTAPYIYLFDSGLRHHFLDWMGASLEDIVVIVDEAHNLPNYARDLVSAELSMISLDRAAAEAREFGKEGTALKILGDMLIPDLAEQLKTMYVQLVEDYVLEDDGLVPPYELEEELMHTLRLTSNNLKRGIGELINHGLAIQDERLKQGRLPRSYIHAMGHFLMWWMEMESTRYIKLIKGGENPTLELYCMDPSEVISVVKACHASIHMSGTLRPLDEYRISSGLTRDALLRIFPSPFPPENRVVLYQSGVTTRYEDLTVQMIHRLIDSTLEICSNIQRNIMIFFPSFKLLNLFLDSGFSFSLRRPLFIEEQGLDQSIIMARVEEFKRLGGVFFSVIGGRMSEGMDFPADILEIVIMEGIPYPKPTARQRALQHYYEVRFGKGWEYTVKAPTTRKVLQSLGRLIRSEHDRGVAIILDKRAVHFREDIPDLRESEDLIGDITAFFARTPTDRR